MFHLLDPNDGQWKQDALNVIIQLVVENTVRTFYKMIQ